MDYRNQYNRPRVPWGRYAVVAAIVALGVIMWASGVFAQEAVVVSPREAFANEAAGFVNQVILALMGLLASAALAAIAWASAALRGWMQTRNLLGLRKIFDDAVANAAHRLGDTILQMDKQAVARYFAEYVREGIPDTLTKLGAGDLELRMGVEAIKYIRAATEQAEWRRSQGYSAFPSGLVQASAIPVEDPTRTD